MIFVKNNNGDNMHEIDLSKYKVRTDLALESLEQENINSNNIKKYDDVVVTTIQVDESLSKKLNKKIGTYITIEFDDVTDTNNKKHVEKIFSMYLKKLLKKQKFIFITIDPIVIASERDSDGNTLKFNNNVNVFKKTT